MDIVGRISHDLENEGVQLSNNKILKILQALKNIVKAYYRAYVKLSSAPVEEGAAVVDHATDLTGRLTTQI